MINYGAIARRHVIAPAIWMASILALISTAWSADLQIGKAMVDITPVPGTPMLTRMGSPNVVLSEASEDPICVRAIVLKQGGVAAAIVCCDVTSIPNPIFDSARKLIVEATGIDGDAIMISATHTHTAPQIRERLLGNVDAEARRKALDYIESLSRKMAQAVTVAHAHLQPAHAFAGIGTENSISFNRRYVMADGTVITNPGKTDPALLKQIVRPAGPIDADVGIVYFESQDKTPLATEVNFAIHLDTVGGPVPSADFPSTLHKILSKSRGPEMLSLFAVGAAGNINHFNLGDPENPRRVKGPEESARIGTRLAEAVLRTSPSLQSLDCSSLRYARRTVELDLPREKGANLAARFNNATSFFDGEMTVHNEAGRQWFEAEVQVIALGSELAWVGLPGEMFVEFGIALKQTSPYKFTMIHELANRSIGYVPNLQAYSEGGYEVTATRCAPGSGEQLVDAASKLLVELKAQKPQ